MGNNFVCAIVYAWGVTDKKNFKNLFYCYRVEPSCYPYESSSRFFLLWLEVKSEMKMQFNYSTPCAVFALNKVYFSNFLPEKY